MPPFDTQGLQAVGWSGFLDYEYLLWSFAALVLATVLGSLVAFHPTVRRHIDTREEAELPKVYAMYALVGAVVGVIVLEYGVVVGFVVFGLGGLMRFRTDTTSARDTGRLILVTLIGLISGLNLPHFAVVATLFAWVLIFIFDGNPVCHLEVNEIPDGKVKLAADAYRQLLIELGCRIISEKKSFGKRRVELIFRAPRDKDREGLHAVLCERIPAEIRGELDWQIE